MSDRVFYVVCGDGCEFEGMTKEQIIAAIAEATGVAVSNIDNAFITKIKERNADRNFQIWLGTQSQYNAIAPADIIPDCLYILTDENYTVQIADNAENITKIVDGDQPVQSAVEAQSAERAQTAESATIAANATNADNAENAEKTDFTNKTWISVTDPVSTTRTAVNGSEVEILVPYSEIGSNGYISRIVALNDFIIADGGIVDLGACAYTQLVNGFSGEVLQLVSVSVKLMFSLNQQAEGWKVWVKKEVTTTDINGVSSAIDEPTVTTYPSYKYRVLR